MRISKNWFKNFAKPVWETINLYGGVDLSLLQPDVIEKYGRYIHNVYNPRLPDDIVFLQNEAFNSIKRLYIRTESDIESMQLFANILNRNNQSLNDLR
ncbi:hypothetical protein BGW39_008314, partial [Mortierella sp. 14UC]